MDGGRQCRRRRAGGCSQLRSGRSLNTGMPGIFTWAGYHNVFLPLLPSVTQDVAEDDWVLGREHAAASPGR